MSGRSGYIFGFCIIFIVYLLEVQKSYGKKSSKFLFYFK